jgi:hypothetical protein
MKLMPIIYATCGIILDCLFVYITTRKCWLATLYLDTCNFRHKPKKVQEPQSDKWSGLLGTCWERAGSWV